MSESVLGWCDENMRRVYPLDDSATCLSESGAALPQSLLSDMQLLTPKLESTAGVEGFFISAVIRNETSIRIQISYQIDSDTAVLCAQTGDISLSTINTASVTARTEQLVPVANAYPWLTGIIGYVVIGTCRDMTGLGTMTFKYAATRIIGVRVYECMAGLESVTFTSDSGSHAMRSDFTIQAGDGIDFIVNGSTINVVRVPTAEEAASPMTSIEATIGAIYRAMGTPIRTINGMAPDSDMNFTISGADCVALDKVASGIVLSNPCAQPCCDEASADDVNTSLSLLEEASKRLEAYYSALTDNINNMQARLSALIASRK